MPGEAIALFKQVEKPDEVIVMLLFNACAQLKTVEARHLVKEVAASMPKSSYSNEHLMTSLLDALMKCGDVAGAQSLFDGSTKKVVSMYAAMMKGTRLSREQNKRVLLLLGQVTSRTVCQRQPLISTLKCRILVT